MRDFAWLTFRNDKIVARHRSPGDIGRAGTSAAIYAMTIAQSKGRTFQQVPCPAANASASKLHKIRLAHFSHEFTPMTRIVVAAGRRPRFHSAGWGRRRGDLVIACPERIRTELPTVAALKAISGCGLPGCAFPDHRGIFFLDSSLAFPRTIRHQPIPYETSSLVFHHLCFSVCSFRE